MKKLVPLFEEDTWSIVESNFIDRPYFIRHDCKSKVHGYTTNHWAWFTKFNRCSICFNRTPDSVKTLYCLLTDKTFEDDEFYWRVIAP